MEPLAVLLLFGPIGTTEIIVVVVILLLLFGGRKIPELAKGLGKGITEFRRGLQGGAAGHEKEPPAELPPEGTARDTSAPADDAERR